MSCLNSVGEAVDEDDWYNEDGEDHMTEDVYEDYWDNEVEQVENNEDKNNADENNQSYQDEAHALEQHDCNHAGLTSLFQLLPQLESLEMRYFRRFRQPLDSCYERHLQYILKLDNLPSLVQCKLRGFYVRQVDLLAFIKRTRVRELSLERVCLASGTFGPIFEYCTSSAAPITKLYLNVLFERSPRPSDVLFLGSGESRLEDDPGGLEMNYSSRAATTLNDLFLTMLVVPWTVSPMCGFISSTINMGMMGVNVVCTKEPSN
jgi:hypothetical protein